MTQEKNDDTIRTWLRYKECIDEQKPVDKWVLDYLYHCASEIERILKSKDSSEKGFKWKKATLEAFGFVANGGGRGTPFSYYQKKMRDWNLYLPIIDQHQGNDLDALILDVSQKTGKSERSVRGAWERFAPRDEPKEFGNGISVNFRKFYQNFNKDKHQ